MAEEEKREKEGTEPAGPAELRPRRRKPLLLAGGVVGILGLALVAAVAAVPSRREAPGMQGPFRLDLLAEKFTVNLNESGRKRYLQLKPIAVYYAYKESYAKQRTTDELFVPYLHDRMIAVTATKTKEDVYGRLGESAFMVELRDALDPILFPVHVGDTKLATDADARSGLRPGFSMELATFRGEFHGHVLRVDAAAGTVQLDDGPLVEFEGREVDLAVPSSAGEVLYLDVSGLAEGFAGEVHVGVHGRIVRILAEELLIQ